MVGPRLAQDDAEGVVLEFGEDDGVHVRHSAGGDLRGVPCRIEVGFQIEAACGSAGPRLDGEVLAG